MTLKIKRDKGFGYIDSTNKRICMERCFKCGEENHAFVVASGKCAFCGFDPNDKKEPKEPQQLP